MQRSFFLLTALLLTAAVHAADLQVRTVDGQVIQGEYIGTENDLVQIRTLYGTVTIPSKSIVTLTAATPPEKPAAPEAPPANAAPAATTQFTNTDTKKVVFPEPKPVNLPSWVASRMPKIPDAGKQDRIELFRLVRNFGESSDTSRQKIIRNLSTFGTMAYPFIEGSYTSSNDLNDKVELLQAVAGAHHPYSAQLLMITHGVAVAELSKTASEPAQLPNEVVTIRRMSQTKTQRLRTVARDIRAIEGYAAMSGGPFNALFLLNLYKERYGVDSNPLLKDILTDRSRLAGTANDYKNPVSGWTPPDRVLLIESAFPIYFRDNGDLKDMMEDFLRKLLPEKHPPFDAPQSEWVEWWTVQKEVILRGK